MKAHGKQIESAKENSTESDGMQLRIGLRSDLPARQVHVGMLWICLGLGFACTLSSPAQILQEWTHASTIGESSAAVAMDENYMFVVDNEDEYLRLYNRAPDNPCLPPVYSFYSRPNLNLSSTNPEADLEAAVKFTDDSGTRIYWLGSHSNSKSGNARPNRNRIFATQVTGNGTGTTPYQLSHIGRYDHLRADLIAWDQNNLHGKGANYFGLAASAATGVIPTRTDGFNIEGLVMGPDGTTAYLAFRTPLVNGSGPTTSALQRTNALIVPLLNMATLVTGNPTTGPGTARFGQPFTLNLGGRGVRSIDSGYPGHYLITAGPAADPSVPPAAPFNFRLFTWTGAPDATPVESTTEIPAGYAPEGAMVPPGPITDATIAQFVSDDPTGCWRSFTAHAAPAPATPANAAPVLDSIANRVVTAGAMLTFNFTASDPDAPGQQLSFSIHNAPGNATIDSAHCNFCWRPTIAQCGMTNTFKLVATDNGTPSISVTQTFVVTVVAPARPYLLPAPESSGSYGFLITGDNGPDYAVQASTNLTDWETVESFQAPAVPFVWNDPEANQFRARFYRVQLGP